MTVTIKASGWFVPALRYSSLNDFFVITSKKAKIAWERQTTNRGIVDPKVQDAIGHTVIPGEQEIVRKSWPRRPPESEQKDRSV